MMKKLEQSITLEHWKQLSSSEKDLVIKIFLSPGPYLYDEIYKNGIELSTSHLIDYLGEDLHQIHLLKTDTLQDEWRVYVGNKEFKGKELVDVLWEAVKNKLKTHEKTKR